MKKRDYARLKAVRTQSNEDWLKYRSLKNSFIKLVKNDKIEHFNKMFIDHEEGNDVSKLYQKIKHQLGWNTNRPPNH